MTWKTSYSRAREGTRGLIPEVVLTAADTFHEMLAAYRNKMQPPGWCRAPRTHPALLRRTSGRARDYEERDRRTRGKVRLD